MLEPFQLPYVQHGLYEVLLLSIAGGLLGTWIVVRGLAFYAHAVGTAAFPGLVLADGLAFAAPLGAFATAVVFAGGVSWLARGRRTGYDSLTALVLVGCLAGGVILASDVFRSGSNIDTLLFGSLLVIGTGDLVFAAAAAVVVVAASALLGRRWLAIGFDADAARALGVRSSSADVALLLVIALASTAALAAIGALLTTALFVIPAATVRLWTRRMPAWQAGSVALAAAEGTAGLWLSVETNTPPGAAIAVMAGAVFALAALARRVPRPQRRLVVAGAAAVALLALTGCGSDDDNGSAATKTDSGGEPRAVVGTTTQLGDFARAVGGSDVKVTQILEPNTDPHEYEPRPDDVQATAGAQVILTSGDNLDRWMGDVVEQSGAKAKVIDLASSAQLKIAGEEKGPEASRFDPHWWHDPQSAKAAVEQIRDALVKADRSRKEAFEGNAGAYLAKLDALDAGIRKCIDSVPTGERKLVTDHDAFNYFTERYGVDVIGAVIPSQTTQAGSSAGELAKLAETIKQEGVKAVFPESSINPKVVNAIARETGASADFTLYGDTLGPEGSDGATYLESEAHNADAMVRGFTGNARGCAIAGVS